MVSKRWQKKQSIVQHTSLSLIWGGSLFWFQLDLPTWSTLLLVGGTSALALVAGIFLNRRYAGSLVRVLELKDEVVTHIVQRALNASYIPFSRQTTPEQVQFTLRNQGLILLVRSYPLNLPYDDHIFPVPASKIEIRGLTTTNEALVEKLCQAIDQTAAR